MKLFDSLLQDDDDDDDDDDNDHHHHDHGLDWHRFISVTVVMRITHSRDKSVPSYIMGPNLKAVKCEKDLGVLVSSDLSWSTHVAAVVNKVNKISII